MRTRTTTVAVVLLLAALTACTSSARPEPSPSASNSPSPSPSPTGPRALGTPWRWNLNGYSGTTTVLAYNQPVKLSRQPGASLGFPDGGVWVTIDVKVCPDKTSRNITVSQFPWSLAFPDGSRVEVTGLNGGDFPKPEFPTDDTTVRAGDCLRGYIPFAIGKGARPDRIVYSVDEEPIEWQVPAE